MQANFRWPLLLLTATLLTACGSSDRPGLSDSSTKPSAAATEAKALRTFTSDTAQTRLLLRADSTFVLEMSGVGQGALQSITGRLKITDAHYRLFFPDTVARFNELITPVHTDASVVAYPDYSVVLDKKLRQLYVKGVLVSADTTGQP